MIRRSFYLASLLMLVCFPVRSQDTAEEAIKKLVGTNAKLWVFKNITRIKIGPRCETGETWRFYADGHVSVNRCVDGAMKEVEVHHWEVRQISDLDVGIKIGNDEYRLIFPSTNGDKEIMILRERPHNQTEEAKDHNFHHP